MLKLNFTATSDRGLVRQNNEDSAYAGPYLLALADGMGGHAAGEVASQMMIQHLKHLDKDAGDNDMLALLGAAGDDANSAIAAHVDANPETEGMGTTLTAMMFNGHHFGVAHVGDSRAYLLRGGKLRQITKDDTFVQSLVDEGRLDPDDVSSHPQKSLILKAYTGRPVDPTLFVLDAQVGDKLLLCSDGLSDPVTASTIEAAMGYGTLPEIASRLVELALRSGGPDNVTVVVAEVIDADGAPAPEGSDASAMPGKPVVAGALTGDTEEPTHPDSAASRAAALNRQPQVIEPHQKKVAAAGAAGVGAGAGAGSARAGEAEGGEPIDAEEDHRPRSKRGVWTVVSVLILVLALVAGGLFGARAYLGNNYYVAQAAETQALTIEKGADYSIFGWNLHSTYQHACINARGELQLSGHECEGDFTPFKVGDLPESERGAVNHLDGGDYDQVQTQLSRLSDKVLPVCRTAPASDEPRERSSAAPTSEAAASSTASSAAAQLSESARAAANSEEPESSNTAAPKGDYLTSPGVNCREVS